jgi:hypothetical protein
MVLGTPAILTEDTGADGWIRTGLPVWTGRFGTGALSVRQGRVPLRIGGESFLPRSMRTQLITASCKQRLTRELEEKHRRACLN